ncbi:hypothetical protein EIN_330390 [Entamoeba invadens IP1]|uniref:Uncharacterized protein n=1 Tax=Entamoeba invadens IP1 TaxID=370355 RepID=L7FMB6_ENTIV|nr:hypothetical protein EIN_330390 [Entamoeba invadens IP1]ELP88755.1 hypothetical protein EIN_330390 [Entamoeba invadens IP1]|eukprot:XP_004255526.1 hypothetical protein EIN_330390 [Entamoeba invadens IP1]
MARVYTEEFKYGKIKIFSKDKEIEALKKKLAEEIAKREVAEMALSEMKIKNVDLEALVKKLKEDIESKNVSLDKADMKSQKIKNTLRNSKKKLEAEEDNSKDLETQLRVKEDDIAYLEKEVAVLKDQNTRLDAAKKNMKKWSIERNED